MTVVNSTCAARRVTLISNTQDGFAQIAEALTAHFAGSGGGKREGITGIGSPLQKKRKLQESSADDNSRMQKLMISGSMRIMIA